MKKLLVIVALAVGYVLGTKAGRARYEQIMQAFRKVKDDPRVQEKTHQAAGLAKEKASQAAGAAVDKAPAVKDALVGAAGAAAAKIKPGSGDGEGAGATVEDLHPDSTARQEDSGPQGDLP
jgi:hypothetical protein